MSEQGDILKVIDGCKQSHPLAQKSLYEQYAGKLFGVCLSYSVDESDAADTLHDGFMKIFGSIKQYKGDGSFEGWMRRIMVNTALERYRRTKRMEVIAADIRATAESSIDNILDEIAAKEIMEVVNRLSPQYRLVFMLYAVEGYSHKDISEKLGISEGTSKSNLSRARGILQEKIREQQHETTTSDSKRAHTMIIEDVNTIKR